MATESRDMYRGGHGKPLVLLHPFASNWREWKPVLEGLSANREVLAPSLPGHFEARSLPSDVAPTIAALADDVEHRLDEAGFEAPDVVGNSLGAWVALELARRGRARSVVAIGPAGGWSPAEGVELHRYLRKAYADTRRLYRIGQFLCRFRAGRWALYRDYYAHPGRLEPADAREGLDSILGCSVFAGVLDALATPDGGLANAEGLSEIRCPVLLLYGSKDKITPPHQARFFLDRIPDARSVQLPGLGHLPMIDDPQLVARTILDFSPDTAERSGATAVGETGESNHRGTVEATPEGATVS